MSVRRVVKRFRVFELNHLNSRRDMMRRKSYKRFKRAGNGKLVTGLLLGGLVGATVGWLTAPAAGEETRRRLKGEVRSARERAKTAAGNVESQARELVETISDRAETKKKRISSASRGRTTAGVK
jgi:gas vesicle protein